MLSFSAEIGSACVTTALLFGSLQFPVEPYAEDGHRPAITIECRVADELVIHGRMDRFPNWEIIIGFQNFLAAVGQRAVAGFDAQAACVQVLLVRARGAAHEAGKPLGVPRPLPLPPLDADPQ